MSTIATALSEAQGNRIPVEILVEGHCLRGDVARVDGYGVVLEGECDRQSIIRFESIAAVTVGAQAPAVSSQPIQPMRPSRRAVLV